MTVQQLIEKLSQYKSDLNVVVCNDDGDELPIVSIEQSADIGDKEFPQVVALWVS